MFVLSLFDTVKPVDITDLLDSHLSHQPDLEPGSDQQPTSPTITTNNHHHQDHSSSSNIIENIIDNIKKPGPYHPHEPPNTHPPPPPPSSGRASTPAASTLSESMPFVHGVLPDHPLQGFKPSDQDNDGNNNKIDEGSTDATKEGGKNSSAIIEGSPKNKPNPQDNNNSNKSNKVATVNLGLLIAIIVMVIIFVLILVGVLKEHKYLRFRGAVCLRRGKVPVHSNGRVNGAASKLRSNPKKTLHSLLGPSQLGFSRLRTYDSDSEEEEFPVFNRV